jgi:predicted AlkP superfamily phosphohydrolase/phosphomutase
MPARVLVIGLDAAESTLLERWSAEGRLPSISALAAGGAVWRLDNPLETLPGAVWPEIETGRSCGKMAQYFHPDQIHTGEGRLRPVRREEIDTAQYYWSIASRAGCRVAVIDPSHAVASGSLNGVELMQWGAHDRVYGLAAHLPGEYSRLLVRHGEYPVFSCDTYRPDRRGAERLLADLVRGIERKRALLLDVLHGEDWDLFSCELSESHCVGHHFWHFHDVSDADHDSRAPRHLRKAISRVYAGLDETVAALIAAAGGKCTTLVFASHGMGPIVGGYLLLWEVLVRLGLGSDRGAARGSVLRRFQYALKDRVPLPWVPLAQEVAGVAPIRHVLEHAGCAAFPLESPHTRAAPLPNNRVGAVRLNLKGREPYGCVEPGREAEDLIRELRTELLALEHPERGEPIVKRVVTAREVFGDNHHPGVPDLMVVFRTDLGRLEACRSARVGLVRAPVRNARINRTGDHTVESRLWMIGPNVAAGGAVRQGNVLDIAPTVLDLLGVSHVEGLDGRPLGQRLPPSPMQAPFAPQTSRV